MELEVWDDILALFGEGEAAQLDIRGLTANQLYLAREARENNTVRRALQEALAADNVPAMKAACGLWV